MPGRLILASGSIVRAHLLENAGVACQIIPADVDESAIKQQMAGKKPAVIARALAAAKAATVSAENPRAFVIGADQMLECEGRLYDKPSDMAAARAHLQSLNGRAHRLLTATVVQRNLETVWVHEEAPVLTMRPLDEAAIAHYLDQVGDAALSSVGAYQLEGLGAQLFEKVEGDFFSILGLPLLPLLAFLRQQSVISD